MNYIAAVLIVEFLALLVVVHVALFSSPYQDGAPHWGERP